MDILTALLPFAIAGSILPTWTLVVIALLGTQRPVANASAFVAGNAAFRLLLGLMVLLVIPLPESESFRLDSGTYDARLVLAFGVALFALALWIWSRSGDPRAGEWVERAERIRPRTSFVAGAVAVASPGVQYAYLLGGIAAILETGSTAEGVFALVLFVVTLQWMLALPIAIYVLFRERASRILANLKGFLRKRGNQLVAGVLGLAGSYVIVLGFVQLRG